MTEKNSNTIEPLLLDFPKAAAALNISLSHLHNLNNRGHIVSPKKVGSRRLFSVVDLRAWVAANCPPRAEMAMKDKK